MLKSLTLAFVSIWFAVGCCKGAPAKAEEGPRAAANSAAVVPSAPTLGPPPIGYRDLGVIPHASHGTVPTVVDTPEEKARFDWKLVLVEGKPTKDQLVNLAKHLHKGDPKSKYEIVNDEKELFAYKKWRDNPTSVRDRDGTIRTTWTDCSDKSFCQQQIKTRKGLPYPFPKEWAEKHHLAEVYPNFDIKGPRWAIHDGFAGGLGTIAEYLDP